MHAGRLPHIAASAVATMLISGASNDALAHRSIPSRFERFFGKL